MTETNQSREISEEIYHRAYRLIKRKLSPHTIAATLNLPLRTILGVINRIERNEGITLISAEKPTGATSAANPDFLDIYFYPKTRYAILDFVGLLSDTYLEKVHIELNKALSSSWKAIAIRMSDVVSISPAIAAFIIESKEKYTLMGRYLAILDPAPAIDQSLIELGIEAKIPIFGTESAFEDAAFSKRVTTFARRTTPSS